MFLTDFVYFKFIISIKSYHKMKIFKKKKENVDLEELALKVIILYEQID